MIHFDRPYSAACDENREPILGVIEPLFRNTKRILEIGTGTGQHAIYFAAAMPHLIWHTSDVEANLPGIQLWLREAALPNLAAPLTLDVNDTWPDAGFDGAFSANTAHIMSANEVAAMFRGVGRILAGGGSFALYGPFKVAGRHTSESNARFDDWLRARDPRMGVRDLEDLRLLGTENGLTLIADHQMPVNNRILVWRREA